MLAETGWHQSTYCGSAACMEIHFEASTAYCGSSACVETGFQKSYYSGDLNCVEVDTCDCTDGSGHGKVLVRDSKDVSGPYLSFTKTTWADFLTGVRAGDFG